MLKQFAHLLMLTVFCSLEHLKVFSIEFRKFPFTEKQVTGHEPKNFIHIRICRLDYDFKNECFFFNIVL